MHNLQEISGALKRIWEHVPVTCPKEHCSWAGTVGNYTEHAQRCMSAQDYEHQIRELEENYENQLEELRRELANAEQRSDEALQRLRTGLLCEQREAVAMARQQCQKEWDEYAAKLTKQLSELKKQCATCKPLDSCYQYDRFRVVELAQFICRNLVSRPNNVDANRIYNCVKNCYDAFERGWADNPEHYLLDVRMLLNVCRASAWFSPKQKENFSEWCANQSW
jgi:vacuolar-type H+-ATPase subunit H